MNKFFVIWTSESESDIDAVYEFYLLLSQELALKIISEIIFETERLVFSEQYQVDEINANYRRIIVSHFKILYRIIDNQIVVFAVFDSRQNPEKLKELRR